MKHCEYHPPKVEILLLDGEDIIATSGDPVLLPPDDFREI